MFELAIRVKSETSFRPLERAIRVANMRELINQES